MGKVDAQIIYNLRVCGWPMRRKLHVTT